MEGSYEGWEVRTQCVMKGSEDPVVGVLLSPLVLKDRSTNSDNITDAEIDKILENSSRLVDEFITKGVQNVKLIHTQRIQPK